MVFLFGCKTNNEKDNTKISTVTNSVKYAKGLELFHYKGFTVMKVTKPWPEATTGFTYILKEKDGIIPDSLKQFPVISIPIHSIVVTSTSHIPALEMLGVENSLIGFPTTNFISSSKTRKRIDDGKVREVGVNESLNTEVLIDLKPDAIVTFGINNNNSTIDNLMKSGIHVLINGDWTEQSPLGKAEWIKFFAAFVDKNELADSIFNEVEKNYTTLKSLAQKTEKRPTVFTDVKYSDSWYIPGGKSYIAKFFADAGATYLWREDNNTGSVPYSFEQVYVKAKDADFWLNPSTIKTKKEL